MNVGAVQAKLAAGVSTNLYPYFPQKYSRINVYNGLAVAIVLYGIEIRTLRKKERIKATDINRDEIFQKNSRYTRFDHKKNEEILGEFKLEAADEKLGRQLKLATTCNKTEQQQYFKRNAEL